MTNKMISPFRTSFGVAFLAALIALSPILVTAQDSYGVAAARVANGTGFLRGFSAVSTESLILLRYTGTSALGGTITVAAGGDLTFSQGAVGSSAVDATMECDAAIAASGSRNGIYDLSTPDVACDTLGEVVDLINSQGTNWRAVILDGARANLTDNMFITLSESAGVNSIDGLGLLNDGTTSFSQSIAVCPTRRGR